MDRQKPLGADSDPDAPLVYAINGGKKELFSQLVKRYEQKLFGFGIRMCNNTQDAEDLVQETFLNVFKSIERFRFESKFKNWVYKIASRICLKKRIKAKSAQEQELSFEELAENFRHQTPDEMPEWAKQPIDTLLTVEIKKAMKRSITALPAKYRIILVLRDLEGLSTDETAQILGISKANVKVRLHRARLHLRDQLLGYMADAA